MPILFDLPTDVSVCILMEWLADTRTLLSLDSASARSTRKAYLALVRDSRFLMPQSISFRKKVSDIRHWVTSRGVKIRAMFVHASTLKQMTRISYECLSTVKSLTMSSSMGHQPDMESFRILLRLLPSLTSLTLRNFWSEDQQYIEILSTVASSLGTLWLC